MNTKITDPTEWIHTVTKVLVATRIIELGQPLENGMPCSPSHPGFRMALLRRHGDRTNAMGGSGANELIVTGGHVGTHLDALCHAAIGGRMHGGVDAHAASVGGVFTELGVDTVTPFLCRGVLADLPKLLGVQRLEPGFGISAVHLRAAFADASPGPGEVALIRTGWPQLYHDPAAYVGHDSGVPGITAEAAIYLADMGVRAVCSDTIATDQILPGAGHSALPAHGVLLVERGVHIMEVLTFEDLAATGAREVLYLAVPLRITGATGSPIRPLALLPDHFGH
ncbi:cyclase family protein [Nocardia sp. NPDC047648]|uniref:cyclase family protein n=1 Tax=Nocardia sp. NPDC047648 TaxID=3155625 RepID=UPI0033FAD67A